MNSAPSDWRGYSGINQLWMSESDWLSLNEGSKAAMMEWVALGGTIMVMTADTSDARLDQLRFPSGAGVERRHGLGRLKAWVWDGKNLPTSGMADAIKSASSRSMRKLLGEYNTTKWSLRNAVGDLGLKHGLIFGFVAIFGILMGPALIGFIAQQTSLYVSFGLLTVLVLVQMAMARYVYQRIL